MGSHGGDPWDPMGGSMGSQGEPFGPLGLGDPLAIGDPLALGDPLAGTHWPLGTLGLRDPWALGAQALGPVYYIYGSTLILNDMK